MGAEKESKKSESSATKKEEREDDDHVTNPGDHDVLCGRGGGTNNHSGNVKFRQLVNEHKLKYLAASKVDKPKVARDVVKIWRGMEPPGRFLTRKDDSRRGPGSVKAEGNIWFDVGDKKAREKASQCLRERTPDVLPFVKEMQRQHNILTGQGMRMVEAQMRNMNDPSSMPGGGGNGMNGMQNMGNMNQMNGMNGMGNQMNNMNNMNGMGNMNAMQMNAMQQMNGMGMNNMNNMNGMNGMGNMNNMNGMGNMNGGMGNMNALQMNAMQQMMNNNGNGQGRGGMSNSEVHNAFSTEYMFTHGFDHPQQMGNNMNNDPLSMQSMSQDQGWTAFQQHPGFTGSNDQTSLDPVPLPTDFATGGVQPDAVSSGLGGDTDELTLEEYQASMSGYKYSEGGSGGNQTRTKALQDMQQNSWVKSFYSVDSNKPDLNDSNSSMDLPKSSGVRTQRPKNKNSLEALHNRQAKLANQGMSTRTMQTAASAQSAVSAMSGISMFSEMTDLTTGTNNRDNLSRMISTTSLMSEMTDLSAGLKSIDLTADTKSRK